MVLLLAALAPAILLLIYIYTRDKIEKEPLGLLMALFFCGMLTTISAVVLGLGAEEIWNALGGTHRGLVYLIFDNFIATALMEEGGKFFVTKKLTWKNKNFNYTFDAVVYAVIASLGFAALENILYVYEGGLEVALLRALMSVPGHTFFGVFMGAFYGMAKEADCRGNVAACKSNLRLALLVPVFLHGFYDFCLSTDSDAVVGVFLLLDLGFTIFAFRQVRKLSKADRYIAGTAAPMDNNLTDDRDDE